MVKNRLIDEIIEKTQLPKKEIKEELAAILKEAGLNHIDPSLDELRQATALYLNQVFDFLIGDKKNSSPK
jgi:hypothetical protein